MIVFRIYRVLLKVKDYVKLVRFLNDLFGGDFINKKLKVFKR